MLKRPMKLKELKALTSAELRKHCSDIRRDLFQLKLQKQVGTVENPLRVRSLRRELARAITLASNLE